LRPYLFWAGILADGFFYGARAQLFYIFPK